MTDPNGGPGAPGPARREVPDREGAAPRVCILLDMLGPGGIATSVFVLCRRLLAAGCEVDLLRLGREDWSLSRVPDGVRTMLLQDAAPRCGKTARGKNAGRPPASGAGKLFIELSETERRLVLAPDVARHIGEALSWNGLRACRRMLKLNRRAIKGMLRLDFSFLIWMAHCAACASRLSRYIERAQPDVIYAAGSAANIAASLTRRMTARRPRLVVSLHGNMYRGITDLIPLASALLPEADAIHAVSRGVADEAAQDYGISRAAFTVEYNPAFHNELPDLKRRKIEHPWIARKGGDKIILCAGRKAGAKDLPTMLRAFRILCDRRKARLILLSLPPEWGREMAERLAGEAADRVLCPGYVESPFPWMAAADVFVLSSVLEGFGNVLVEAMACGCPVVSTDCRHGPREILEDGRWGRLTPVGDPQALAEAIDETLENPLPAEELIARARDFSEDRIIPRWMKMLGVSLPAAGAPAAAGAARAGASAEH